MTSRDVILKAMIIVTYIWVWVRDYSKPTRPKVKPILARKFGYDPLPTGKEILLTNCLTLQVLITSVNSNVMPYYVLSHSFTLNMRCHLSDGPNSKIKL